MIIDRNVSRFVVFSEDSILNALNKISANKEGVIFTVSEGGILEGALTDGDLRRWLIGTDQIDINQSVSSIINKNIIHARFDSQPQSIARLLDNRCKAVPLVDGQHRIIAIAFGHHKAIEIGGRVISEEDPAFVIAEIGNNHNGSLDLAKQLIDEAVRAGADCAKFQMRSLSKLYKNPQDTVDDTADLGTQYTLDLLSRFQLKDEELFAAFDYCHTQGIIPLCTPWDEESLEKLDRYGLEAFKVASADFTNYDLISAIAKTRKPMLCSTGMTTEAEIKQGIAHLRNLAAPFVLLHCNSTYPAPFKDINIKYMLHLQREGECLVGYSGHERGINIAISAVALGAKVIEKHFTLDRTMEGNDHRVSLLPDEFAQMMAGIRETEAALGNVEERSVSQGEMMNRENLAKSLIAAVDIPPGTEITADMIEVKCPGQGLQPNRKGELIGRRIQSEKKAGDFFFPSDLGSGRVKPQDFSFPLAWGMPVRYHDLHKMVSLTNMDLVEIHLSYKDMEVDLSDYFGNPLGLDLVVHTPELFAGDHTLDLCSTNHDYRQRSLSEMQRVVDIARELSGHFTTSAPIRLVTNVGGFSHDSHLGPGGTAALYEILEDSLSKLDTEGVEIIPQTMPPFPWHFGGQQFHNLFVDPVEISDFCRRNGTRICLDVSHSKLACAHHGWSFSEFVNQVAPYTAHLHLADAAGVDGEGLQIEEGDIDWRALAQQVLQQMPGASFIPEIWQGHKNDGEGALKALQRLEKHFKQAQNRIADTIYAAVGE
ncbi:N-acetylneuraminate synthase [Roseibium hamelinense]|uniref:N-acetylneuraminate synthase n=1 Tax=Roseibium hamelinense TaxID=150831 RepID=A0A562T9F8_9HYPH|nr:N-acetylneuraminate synthase family protein [Roseibium hamelinense]MTI43560.1 acetylneuraminic acid synthetase [Roseibium hamelinense]TWI89646.1 N-acetylneuraminate synthase [Roseibium hamelinense]